MTAARTCGATFAKAVAPHAGGGPTQMLTIAPVPTGGTLEGVDIMCGTKGSVCSAQSSRRRAVELASDGRSRLHVHGLQGRLRAARAHADDRSAHLQRHVLADGRGLAAPPLKTPPAPPRGRSGGAGAARRRRPCDRSRAHTAAAARQPPAEPQVRSSIRPRPPRSRWRRRRPTRSSRRARSRRC